MILAWDGGGRPPVRAMQVDILVWRNKTQRVHQQIKDIW